MVAQPRNKAISPDWEKSAVSNTLAALGRLEVARGETESAATRLDKALPELVEEARGRRGHVVIRRRDRPVAVLLSVEEFDVLLEYRTRYLKSLFEEAMSNPGVPLRGFLGEFL